MIKTATLALSLLILASPAFASSKPKPHSQPIPGVVVNNNDHSGTWHTNTNHNSNINQNAQINNSRQTATSSSRSSSRSSVRNSGNSSVSYTEARDRLQAPGVSGSFSSVVGSPCEGVPFGLGGSGPGFSALFQFPNERDRCWGERQAERLMAWGCSNAAIAVLAGNPVAVALQNNPCNVRRRR